MGSSMGKGGENGVGVGFLGSLRVPFRAVRVLFYTAAFGAAESTPWGGGGGRGSRFKSLLPVLRPPHPVLRPSLPPSRSFRPFHDFAPPRHVARPPPIASRPDRVTSLLHQSAFATARPGKPCDGAPGPAVVVGSGQGLGAQCGFPGSRGHHAPPAGASPGGGVRPRHAAAAGPATPHLQGGRGSGGVTGQWLREVGGVIGTGGCNSQWLAGVIGTGGRSSQWLREVGGVMRAVEWVAANRSTRWAGLYCYRAGLRRYQI